MKAAVKITFLVVVLTARAVYGMGWPPDYREVVPGRPDPCDVVAITLGGEWPDSCIPRNLNSVVVGNDIYIDLFHPGKSPCNYVVTDWSHTEYAGPLAEGSYRVWAKVIGYSQVPEMYTQVTGFRVKYCGESIVEDFNGDCFVDFFDFGYIAEAWKSGPDDDNWNAACDISEPNDDFIDELDLRVLVDLWGADI
ncbi:MAG: hypothetical protein JSV99_10335 [Planctomycetota bacterium]|nr:MAG: hypothetical protein JSV99_10335 [Planctomycetota bacterium]